jgi:hypothetical protein
MERKNGTCDQGVKERADHILRTSSLSHTIIPRHRPHSNVQQLPQQNSSQTSSSQSTIDESTKKQLAEIESSIKQNREKTIKKVVDRVLQCDPQLHPNLKKVEA